MGKIDAGMFKHALMTWGDKFSAAEVDDIFGEFEIDEDNMIKSKDVIGLFVAQKEEEKKEGGPPETRCVETAGFGPSSYPYKIYIPSGAYFCNLRLTTEIVLSLTGTS